MTLPKANKDKIPLVPVFLIVSQKNSKPMLELRKSTTDYDLIKTIVSCAFHEIPLIILPSFSNKMKAVTSLVDKGVLYRKDNKYYFTF